MYEVVFQYCKKNQEIFVIQSSKAMLGLEFSISDNKDCLNIKLPLKKLCLVIPYVSQTNRSSLITRKLDKTF